MRFSFIFAQKDTGRTPSHLWYFGQRCWLLDDLTDFFGYNTKLPLHMGRAERAAIFLTVTDWVLGLGPPADAGSWVLGLQGTLGLGSWGQAPRPVPRVKTGTRTRDQPTRVCIHSHKLSVVAIHRPHTNQMEVYAGHWSPSEKADEHETQQSCTVRRVQSPEQRKDVSFIMRDQLSIKRLRSWASGQYSPYVPAQTHFVAVAAAEEIVT